MLKMRDFSKMRDKKDSHTKDEEFDDIDEMFVKWLHRSGEKNEKGEYVYPDHSGVILIIGKRRSGKTNLMYGIAKDLQKNDPERVVCLWNTPNADEKIKYLKEVAGFKNVINVSDLKVIPWNALVLIDEGIINVNAKLALTKMAREWDMYQAIISHKRALLFITFQRWEVFASFTEMADCTIYKQLGSKLANRAKDDPFLREHKDYIKALPKNKALVESDLDGLDATGIIHVAKPSWYTGILSEGYKDANLDFELDAVQKRQNTIDAVAMDLIKQGYRLNPQNKKYYFALISKIRREYIQHKFSNTEINSVIQRIYEIMVFEPEKLLEDGVSKEEYDELKKIPNAEAVEQHDLDLAMEFANGKSATAFEQANRTTVMDVIRKCLLYLLNEHYVKSLADKRGNEFERAIANFYLAKGDYVMRALASGGYRGGSKYPQPDFFHILKNGEFRVVQVKTRSEFTETFPPHTFDAELEIVHIIDENIPSLKGQFRPYLYFLPQSVDPSQTWEIPLKAEYNEKVLYVDYERKYFEMREYVPKAEKKVESKEPIPPVPEPESINPKKTENMAKNDIIIKRKVDDTIHRK